MFVLVTNGYVSAGPTENTISLERRKNKIGGQVLPCLIVKPEIDDAGLKCYGPAQIDISVDSVKITHPIVYKTPSECESCLCCRCRSVRDGLVEALQSMIDNWSRKISIATRASEDTTTLESQLADLEDFQQALCDVPQQAGFPNTFDWPVIPVSWQSVEVSGVNVADYYNEKIANWSEPQE